MEKVHSVKDLEMMRDLFAASGPAQESTSCLWVRDARRFLHAPHRVRVPGSKSFTNRAIVLAGMCPAGAPVKLNGILLSDDSYWGFDALLRLGFGLEFDFSQNEVVIVPWQHHAESHDSLGKLREVHLGMAGTLARFFPAVVLNASRHLVAPVVLTGEKRLCERPLADLTHALRALGAKIKGDALPIEVEPWECQNLEVTGHCKISGEKSGQFFSGLILAAGGSRLPIKIDRTDNLVQPDYVRMTIDALEAFGGNVQADPDLQWVKTFPVERLYPMAEGGTYSVEADASTACYFLAMAALFNLDLEILNLGHSSRQPDLQLVTFLERMGAAFEVTPLTVRHICRSNSFLKGGFTADFTAMSDQALTAGVLALFADAPVTITGVAHIRKHESDRVACLCSNLQGLGVQVTEFADGFTVCPLPAGAPPLAGRWPTHADHRFAMVGALLAIAEPGVGVENPSCCEKTAPGFFTELEKRGVEFRVEV